MIGRGWIDRRVEIWFGLLIVLALICVLDLICTYSRAKHAAIATTPGLVMRGPERESDEHAVRYEARYNQTYAKPDSFYTNAARWWSGVRIDPSKRILQEYTPCASALWPEYPLSAQAAWCCERGVHEAPAMFGEMLVCMYCGCDALISEPTTMREVQRTIDEHILDEILLLRADVREIRKELE
jgi:hypothetical protein